MLTQEQQKSLETIQHAMLYLSSVCDLAKSRDGHGYSSRDAEFANSIAAKVANGGTFTVNMVRAMAKVLRTYGHGATSQLGQAGIILPTPQHVDDLLAAMTFIKAAKAPGTITIENDALVIRFEYDSAQYERVKSLHRKYHGAGWVPAQQKAWVITLSPESIMAAKETFPTFTVGPEVEEMLLALENAIEEGRERVELEAMEKKMRTNGLLAAVGDLTKPLPNGMYLYTHQITGVKWLLETERAILADDMGLGKTLQAVVAAKAYHIRVIVICPLTLKNDWVKTAQWVEVPIEVYSWAKLPEPLEGEPYVLIADEAQYAQTWGYYKWTQDEEDPEDEGHWTVKGVKRTADFIRLARHDNCEATYLLTGTPLKNGRPANLYPLLYAIRHPITASKREYEKTYCNAHSTGNHYDTTGAAHLDQLHRNIKPMMLKRQKSQCLDLPAFIRIMRPVELSSDATRHYTQIVSALQARYKARVDSGEILPEGEILVMLGILRKAGSSAKTETACDMLDELLESGQQVVIFSAFKESLSLIAGHLAVNDHTFVSLTGDTPAQERASNILQFQNEKAQVFLTTFGAGGVGVTLTAASTVILLDRPWTPGDAFQAEARIDRIGQTANTTSYWLQESVIDPKIDALLIEKQQRIDLVMEGKRKTMRGLVDFKKLAREILEFVFYGKEHELEQATEELAETPAS